MAYNDSDQKCSKFDILSEIEIESNEKIVHASFLDDNDPTFIVIITINEAEYCSYLYLAKVKSNSGRKWNRISGDLVEPAEEIKEHDEEKQK